MFSQPCRGRRFALLVVLAAAAPALANPPATQPSTPAAAATASVLEPVPEKLSVQAFSATPFMGDPKLSPDGKRVAARMNVNGSEAFGVFHVGGKSAGAPKVISTGEHALRWFRWAGNDRVLISLGMITSWAGMELYMTRLLAYEVNTGTAQAIGMKSEGPVGDDVLYVADDGSFLLLAVAKDVFSYPGVFRVDLPGGAMTRVLAPKTPIHDWYADSSGFVRLGFGYSGRSRFKIFYREPGEEKFRTVAKLDLEDLEGEIDTVRFRTLGDKGYVVSNAKTGRFSLYEFDWKNFEFGKAVFEHPTVDMDDFQMTADGNAIAAIYYTDDRQRVQWLEPAMKELQAEIDAALPNRMNWVASYSRDRERLLVWSGTADDPGHYYVYDRSIRRMERLVTPHEKLQNKKLAPVKVVSYRAADGLEIPAYLTLPVGRTPRNLPLVLMPHGGPHVRDKWEYDFWVQFLANRGYAVLQPNFRGSAGYGKDFMAKGFGQWGTGMQDDLSDGVKWLIAEGIADPRRVCIMGASYGGYAAMMGAIKTPELFRCAISFAGVTDVNDMMRYDRSQLLPSRYKRWREQVRGEKEVDLKDVSPVNHAAAVGIPLLLMHGTADGNVPYRQAEKFIKAMSKAGKPLDFIEFEGVGHSLTTEQDRAKFLAAVETFLAKHNPAD